jgi:hypothetical protein
MNTITALANSNKTLTYKETYTTPSSSYVVRRSLDKIVPQTGSSDYTPQSTSRIAWRLPAGSFVDVNDLFFSFKLKATATTNTGATAAQIVANSNLLMVWNGSHTLFERMTITCGGVVIEDINNLNVLEQLIHKSTDTDDFVRSPYGEIQGLTYNSGVGISKERLLTKTTEFIFKPKASGILTNDLMLPTPYLPEIIIELYLAKGEYAFTMASIDPNITFESINYTLSDVALNAPYVEFDKDFITGFEASLQKNPLNYHFNTFSCFTQSVNNSSDIAIGSFRTDIKSLFAVCRNKTNISDINKDTFTFARENIEAYQVSLGTAKYPLEQVNVNDDQYAKNLVYNSQALANLKQNHYHTGMNCGRHTYGLEHFFIGLDLSNSDALLGGIDSTLTFGSPLMLQVKGANINSCHMDAFIHYGSILTIMPDRSIVCTF